MKLLTQSGKVEEARSYARSDARILNHDNRTKSSRHHSLSAVRSSFFFRQCFLLQGCVIRGPGSNFRIVLRIQTLSQETLAFLSGDAETLPPRAERGRHKGWERAPRLGGPNFLSRKALRRNNSDSSFLPDSDMNLSPLLTGRVWSPLLRGWRPFVV